MMIIYFTSAMGTIYYLVQVIVPRVRKHKTKIDDKEVGKDEVINPTFFAGISQFNSPEEYALYLKSIAKDDDQLYQMFASQVFALGKINLQKNTNIRFMYFFIAALFIRTPHNYGNGIFKSTPISFLRFLELQLYSFFLLIFFGCISNNNTQVLKACQDPLDPLDRDRLALKVNPGIKGKDGTSISKEDS